MQPLNAVLKYFVLTKRYLGAGTSENSRFAKTQQVLLRNLYYAVIALVIAAYIWTLATPGGSIASKIQTAIEFLIVVCMSLCYLWLVHNGQIYENCLEWCNKFHEKHSNVVLVKGIFEKSAKKCNAVYRRTLIAVVAPISCLVIQGIVLTIVKGRLEPPFSVYFPFVQQNFVSRAIMCPTQYIECTIYIVAMQVTFGVIFVSLNYVMTGLELIRFKLQSYKEDFNKTLTEVVIVHCDILDHLNTLISLTRMAILFFEVTNYGLLLLTWVAIFLEPKVIFIAVAADSVSIFYFMVCWVNEKFRCANDELRTFLYDLEWYTMHPQQRRRLLMLMMMVDCTSSLKAGPFHFAHFDQLARMLQRIYSIGLVVKNVEH